MGRRERGAADAPLAASILSATHTGTAGNSGLKKVGRGLTAIWGF